MANPAEQLAALAKANFGLCVRLAQIAGEEGEEFLRIGNKAIFAAAEQGRTVARRVLPADKAGANPASAASAGAFDLLAETQKGQQRIGGDVKTALEEWQRAWMGALIPSLETNASPNLFGLFLKPWAKRPSANEETKVATPRVDAQASA